MRAGIDEIDVSQMVNLTTLAPDIVTTSSMTHCRVMSCFLIWLLIRQRCEMRRGPSTCGPSGVSV